MDFSYARIRSFIPVRRGVLLSLVLLFWFNTGIEDFRLGHLGDLPQHPYKLFIPPWKPLRAYVSQGGDEKLYWEDSNLILGGEPDFDFLARTRRGDFDSVRASLQTQISKGPGFRIPYRDFPFEYPPLPLALIMIPRLFVDTLADYRIAYGILIGFIAFGACFTGAKLAGELHELAPREPWVRMAFLMAALGPLLVSRTDGLPAFLVVLALYFLARQRSFLAGLCVGAGVMAKLYPLLLVLPWMGMLFGWRRPREAFQLGLGTALAIALIAISFLWIAPENFLHSTFLYGARPFESESIVGALTILIQGTNSVYGSFGSYNVQSPGWIGIAWSVLLPLSVLICFWFSFWQAKSHPNLSRKKKTEHLILWTVAILCFALITSKIISPQYIIWLLPLAAVTPTRAVRQWTLIVAGMTQIYYPFLYAFFVEGGSTLAALWVVSRNLALLVLTCIAFRAAVKGVAVETPRLPNRLVSQ